MNNAKKYREALEDYPIIAAIRNDEELSECLKTECQNVFILYGNLMTIGNIVKKITESGRYAYIHMDMIEGLSGKDISVDYIKTNTSANGIITTKSALIKRAKELDLFAIQRFFILDSLAIKNAKKQIEQSHPDFIEILPGIIPKVIKRFCTEKIHNIIAGGLISDKEDIITILDAGATAISTTNPELWYL